MLRLVLRSHALVLAMLLTLLGLLLAGCDTPGSLAVPTKAAPTAVASPEATPTVNIEQARQTFLAGGELTLREAEALQAEIVGSLNLDGLSVDELQAEIDKYDERSRDFSTKLAKCKLREITGWVTGIRHAYDDTVRILPDTFDVYVSPNDIYARTTDEANPSGYKSNLVLPNLSKTAVASMLEGQRVVLSGDFVSADADFLSDNPASTFALANVKFHLLEDMPVVPAPTDADVVDMKVMLERTMCFGSCPAYTLTIHGDGTVVYGVHGNPNLHASQDKLDKAQLLELVQEIRKADFFNLDSSYSRDVTDLPTYYLTVEMNGQSKRVSNYGAGPVKLFILEDRVDQIAGNEKWLR